MPIEGLPTAKDLANKVRAFLVQDDPSGLARTLSNIEPHVTADAMYSLAREEQQRLLVLLPEERAASVLVKMDPPSQAVLLDQIEPELAARWISTMAADDAADIAGMLPVEQRETLIRTLPPGLAEAVGHLLTFPSDSAGGLMVPHVVRVRVDQTVESATASIRRYVKQVALDEFFSVYVIDSSQKLVGVVPNWKMLLADSTQTVREIMDEAVVSVQALVDQEEVSHLVRDNDLVSLPVVDEQKRLIGRITVDDVVDVMGDEFAEDLGRFSGTGDEEVRELSIVQTLRLRAPWLLIALVGQFLSAVILHTQENLLVLLPQIAFFIPLIMAMGGSTGIQTSSLVIRGLATGEVHLGHFWRRLGREAWVALCIGLGFAVILYGGGMLLTGKAGLGLAVGLATMANIILASSMGIIIPFILKRLDQDPALATGPFLTTMNDIVGILVYLIIAWLILF